MRKLNKQEKHCLDILEQSGQPDRVINHCKIVAETAEALALMLSEKGYALDVSLCFRAGLLHDICRTEKKHAVKGKLYLESLGLYREAEIVGTHMGEDLESDVISENTVVCLADKLVAGGERVSVKERFSPAFIKYANDAEILPILKNRYEAALKLEVFVEKILGSNLQDLSLD